MGAAGKYLRKCLGGYVHWCPACGKSHMIPTGQPLNRPWWMFNGDLESPTFHPSCHLTSQDMGEDGRATGRHTTVCHYFLRAGRIEYCHDNPHQLNGKNVPLPEFPHGN